MKVTTFRSRSVLYGKGDVEKGSIEVADMEAFWLYIRELDRDEKVDSVMIGLDPLDKDVLALDILLR